MSYIKIQFVPHRNPRILPPKRSIGIGSNLSLL